MVIRGLAMIVKTTAPASSRIMLNAKGPILAVDKASRTKILLAAKAIMTKAVKVETYLIDWMLLTGVIRKDWLEDLCQRTFGRKCSRWLCRNSCRVGQLDVRQAF